MSYLSVSTWSLHRLLGPLRWTIWDEALRSHVTNEQAQPQELSLLELPQAAAKRGYQAIEVCHFHFASTDEGYLHQLREAFSEAGVAFDTLLLDYGDLTSQDGDRVQADLLLMREWIKRAAACGAKQIRIVAGEAKPDQHEALRRSASALSELSSFGKTLGVQVVTENFKPLTSVGENALYLAQNCEESIRLITDFGNYHGEGKYEEIKLTTPYSVSVHVKPVYDANGIPDEEELARCLAAVQETRFDGAFVLIYDGPGDMWEGLERVKKLVLPYLND